MKILFYLFLISIPFGYRIILHQWTLGFDEYETAFLYANDIPLILFVGYYLLKNTNFMKYQHTFANLSKINSLNTLFVFVVLSGISIFLATIPLLSLYNFVRLAVLCFLAYSVSEIISRGKINIALILRYIALLAVFEAIIGYIQFVFQKSLGLWWLGESLLGQFVPGSAKIIIENTQILRAYGTFPHPNILGAFLILGLISTYYFWLIRPSEWKIWSGFTTFKSDLVIGVGIFATLLGIALTFSRSAWIVAILVTFFIAFISFFTKHWIQAIRLMVLFASTLMILLVICSPFIFPRSQISTKEPAVSYRLSYDKMGINLIKNNPLGIGLGNQVIYSVDNRVYQDAGMKNVWEWQPIHNIYLLIASEIGLVGLLVFLVFLITILVRGIFNSKTNRLRLELDNYITKIMLISLLMLGLLDHYLWTIEPGRLMLWTVIGMVMGVGMLSQANKVHVSNN